MITELTRKREGQKLKQAQIAEELLAALLFPHENAMRMAFENIISFVCSILFQTGLLRIELV